MSQLSRGQPSRILYVELKSGQNDRGPAWIGRARLSKTGRTFPYRGLKLQSLKGGGIGANYVDLEAGDEYWVSGVKRDGSDRGWTGGGRWTVRGLRYIADR